MVSACRHFVLVAVLSGGLSACSGESVVPDHQSEVEDRVIGDVDAAFQDSTINDHTGEDLTEQDRSVEQGSDLEGAIPETNSNEDVSKVDFIPECHPTESKCVLGFRWGCTLGAWQPNPCPPGQLCVNGECSRTTTAIYLVVDNAFGTGNGTVAGDLYCESRAEAAAAGSACAALKPTSEYCDCTSDLSLSSCDVDFDYPMILNHQVHAILKALEQLSDAHIVLLHAPSRTVDNPPASLGSPEKTICSFGWYRPVFTPQLPGECHGPLEWGCARAFGDLVLQMCDAGHCSCSDGPVLNPTEPLLEELFRYSVVGYPEPWSVPMSELLTWVDGKEELVQTADLCQEDVDCGTGMCKEGACLRHANPELRVLSRSVSYPSPSPALYLAAQFIRLHGNTDGQACKSQADCGLLGALCGADGLCHDDAAACRRHVVIYVSPPHSAGAPMEINVARWMNTGLACSSDADCFGGSTCKSVSVAESSCAHPPVPEAVCQAPAPPKVSSWYANQAYSKLLKGGYEPYPSDPYLGPHGFPRVTTHVVVSAAPHLHAGAPEVMVAEYLLPVLAVAIAGGGRVVLPLDYSIGFQAWMKDECIGPFVGPWKQQLDDLIDAIRKDGEEHVCSPDEVKGTL
jgi:hypothetical protein